MLKEWNCHLGMLSLCLGIAILAMSFALPNTARADTDGKCSATYCSGNCVKSGLSCTGKCETAGAQCDGCDSDEDCTLSFNYCTCGLSV